MQATDTTPVTSDPARPPMLSAFAGRSLAVDAEVYASASETNHRNQSIARLLQSLGRIYCDRRRRSTSTRGSARSR
jgi:glutaminase